MSATQTADEILDRTFLEIRARVLEVAAALDRIERADDDNHAAADPRVQNLRRAIEVLNTDGFDRAEVRQRIETKLLETLGSFTGEIQSAFRNPQNKTVRAALAELMVKGVLTPSRWALIKRSAGDFA